MAAPLHQFEVDAAREIVREAKAVWTAAASAPESLLNDVNALHQNDESNPIVTLSFPGIPVATFVNWLGPRLIYWPDGVTNRHRISIVSSRIGKRKDLKRDWFDALRTAAMRCDVESECLCCVDSTSTAPAVIRASELFGIKRLRLCAPDDEAVDEDGLAVWLSTISGHGTAAVSELERTAFVSPPLPTSADADIFKQRDNILPIVDTLLTFAGQRIIVLSRRRGGNVDRLLDQHLSDSRLRRTVLLASFPESPPDPTADALIDKGAVRWILDRHGKEDALVTDDSDQTSDQPQAQFMHANDGPLVRPDEWLCHWTRPRYGPWSGQDDADFWDELILGCQTADRSAFAALLRIVQQQTILAAKPTQNARPTVSFTAVPLREFRRRRVFRKHKQRHDFEPWGIALHKSFVESLGGKPVTYVDEIPKDASQEIATFLQPIGNTAGTIDWREEREWRVPERVNLQAAPAGSVVVFVDTCLEQQRMQRVSSWPVITTPRPDMGNQT
ncbi:hypothetical protein [Fuerstiella marisgermanici]|uniref:hypothetical protein n=1 Tax=Fuerstiella marisgermanici TaxID=1891926 RepID=UPI00097C8C6E|nr:hypothetical protein [Fuerstiella marisgermanici]